MALRDTLEALAASYKRGQITLAFMACMVKADTISKMLEWCRYYDIDVMGLEHASVLEVQQLDRGYASRGVCNE